MMTVIMHERFGCKQYKLKGLKVWLSGHIYNKYFFDSMIDYLSENSANKVSVYRIKEILIKLRGNFSILIEGKDWVLASVDRIRSFPIFYSKINDFVIGNYAHDIKSFLGLKTCCPDKLSLLSFSMSGYTIGNRTLVKEVFQLTAGEFILVRNNIIYKEFYYNYSPWRVKNNTKASIKKNLSDIIIKILEDMYSSVDGRQIVVPLSAGYDSRLIASGLKEIGAKDVVCLSYGRKDSFEARASKEIANKLGYKWLHKPVTIKSQKYFFESETYREYLTLFDSYASVPAVQDVSEVYDIKINNLVDKSAVFVNGNSGDYITGGHVPTDIQSLSNCNIESLLSKYFNKHYSLWECLKTLESENIIINGLYEVMSHRKIPSDIPSNYMHSVIEFIEYAGRQTMYVVDQQNSYKFSGYDWRLPLWDSVFMDFWEGVPYEYKVNQSLYKEVLLENNWGGAWNGLKVNNYDVGPFWLKTARFMTKSLLAPFGKKKWHKVEKNIFTYWLDVSCNSAITPYKKVLLDKRGQRHFVSWLADQYLISHELGDIKCPKKL